MMSLKRLRSRLHFSHYIVVKINTLTGVFLFERHNVKLGLFNGIINLINIFAYVLQTMWSSITGQRSDL